MINQQVGRYRILGKLGKGAMGVVYLAEDPVLSRRVAIKTVELGPDDRRNQAFLRDRLVRDGRAAAGLSHPNIVSVYDVLEEGEFAYLVMEYIAGDTLAAYLSRVPLPEPPFFLRVLREMASALDYTHARGVIHRDIKPANVMLDSASGGAAKIMDFGIARITDNQTMTAAGTVMGTLEYMAPEQIKGEAIDGRADQFALAAVAYEMLTGCTLYGEHSFATLAYKIVNEMPPALRTRNPGLPPGVEEVVARALRKPPAERFQSCGGFVAALERAFSGEVPETGQMTQAMSIPSAPPVSAALPATELLATGAMPPVTANLVPSQPAIPIVPRTAAVPVTPTGSKRGLLLGVAGVLVAALLGGGLLIWKPWAPAVQITGQPSAPVSEDPTVPGRGAGKTSAAAGPLPKSARPPGANTAKDVLPAPPQPPGVPAAQTQAPQTQTPPAQTSASVTPIPANPPQVEQANDTPPADPIPAEPDPVVEGKTLQPARAAYRQGEQLIRENRYPAAIEQFTKSIEINSEFLRAYFARGAAYLHQNRAADAFADYNEILRRNPRNGIALAQRGVCHARLKDDDAALADFNKALEIRHDLPAALNGRGLVYSHRAQYEKAVQEFTSAIQISPKFGFAYANRARAEQALGNQTAAQADFQRAKELGINIAPK